MKLDHLRLFRHATLLLAISWTCHVPAADPLPLLQAAAFPASKSEDPIKGAVELDPKLDAKFFLESKTLRPWHIVEGAGGSLEDTIDHAIDADDLVLLERTANCTSNHQGEHMMDHCEAAYRREGLILDIMGGMPAYASSLRVVIRPDKTFVCLFDAVYPAPTPPLQWTITKKTLKLRDFPLRPGKRCYGWISVEFEETETTTGKSKTYKIEGDLKPVVQGRTE